MLSQSASSLRDWPSRDCHHVDFDANEPIPLKKEEYLGHGTFGNVYKTICKGVPLAWKERRCRRTIGAQKLKEIWNLKKLNHQHIVKLAGSYTHRLTLGLLIYPVAVCTLNTFFEDMDVFKAEKTNDDIKARDPEPIYRFSQLGIDTTSCSIARDSAGKWLFRCFGCLAGTLAYLHSEDIKIKHKDLKPSNFLLTATGIWIADFGTSTDFSALTGSETDNNERGTARYFAPEVANRDGSGRAADVFSLGCIFLEMFCSCTLSDTLTDSLKHLHPVKDSNGSHFQANIEHIYNRLVPSDVSSIRGRVHEHLLLEITYMLSADPKARPTAAELKTHLGLIDGFRRMNTPDWKDWPIHGACCLPAHAKKSNLYENGRQVQELRRQLYESEQQVKELRERLHKANQQVRSLSTAGSRAWRNSSSISSMSPLNPGMSRIQSAPWPNYTSLPPIDPHGFNWPLSSDEAHHLEQQQDDLEPDKDDQQIFLDRAELQPGIQNGGDWPMLHMRTSDVSRVGIGRSSPENRLPPYLAKSVSNEFATAASQSNRSSTSSHHLVLLRKPHARPFSFPNNHNDGLNATHDSLPDRPTLFLAEGNNNNPYRNRMGSGVGPT